MSTKNLTIITDFTFGHVKTLLEHVHVTIIFKKQDHKNVKKA